MNDIIKLYLKPSVQSPGKHCLGSIRIGDVPIFQSDEGTEILVGSAFYNFKVAVILEGSNEGGIVHEITPTKGKSDTTLRPGDENPGGRNLFE